MSPNGASSDTAVAIPFDTVGQLSGSVVAETSEGTVGTLTTPPSASPLQVRDPSIADSAARLQVLLVDDDRTLREGCSSVLQIDGYAVTSTGRGDEAIDLLRRRKFDIVLVDLYLTPVSGMDILKAALAAHRETIVIVMTGNPSVATSIEALRAGAWDYLPKPFSAQHMQILLGRAAHAVAVARETREFRTRLADQHGNSDRITLL